MPRSLPKKNNPLVQSGQAPPYEELLARRRLGKTNLAVKANQVGTSNATKPENLGPFEYAHLRAPLPKDLKGSGIFSSEASPQHPETYFMMRRSKDGFVSATGMFKIAFPWAKLDEERVEREYLKTQDDTSEDDIAGNVWISPALALELSKEYKMYDWVRALLDPTEIVQSPSSAKKHITPPPKFDLPDADSPTLKAPALSPSQPSSPRKTRRSASPSKKTSPRKSRQTRVKDAGTPGTTAANESLQSALDMTVTETQENEEKDEKANVAEEVSEEKPVEESPKRKAALRSRKAAAAAEDEEEDSKVKAKGKDKTTVSLDVPISLPAAPSTAETAEMIAQAKEMVQDAVKEHTGNADAESIAKTAVKKRKTDKLEEDEDDEASPQRVKRARVLEDKLKRERVRNRALVGVTAAFALAASIPYFF